MRGHLLHHRCDAEFRWAITLSDFEISLSETQRKMSSRFLLIPLKDDDETTTTTTRMRGHLQHHRCDFHVHDASATRTCKIKASKKRVLIKHFSLRISKTFQNNFFFDRSTMMPKTTSRRRRRRKEQLFWTDGAKKVENDSRRLETRSKTFRKLYACGWTHCFGFFWFFRINMEFDTLILHVSVRTSSSRDLRGTRIFPLCFAITSLRFSWSLHSRKNVSRDLSLNLKSSLQYRRLWKVIYK